MTTNTEAEVAKFEAWAADKHFVSPGPAADLARDAYIAGLRATSQKPEKCEECGRRTFHNHPDGYICLHCKLIVGGVGPNTQFALDALVAAGHVEQAKVEQAFAIGAALRTASQGECAAHPGECSMGSHGPGGAIQCKHCGNEATPASASEAVYLVATGDASNHLPTYTRHTICPPMADAETLYAHPAPASAEPAYDKRDTSGEGQEGLNAVRAALEALDSGQAQIARDNLRILEIQLRGAEQQRAGVPAQVSMHDAPDACRDYVAWAQGWNDCRSSILAAAPKPQEGAGNG